MSIRKWSEYPVSMNPFWKLVSWVLDLWLKRNEDKEMSIEFNAIEFDSDITPIVEWVDKVKANESKD